jgi:hypothetical protein
MTAIRAALGASTLLFCTMSLAPGMARADLLGAGKTVQVFYDDGIFPPEAERPVGSTVTDPAPLNVAVDYQEGQFDLATVHVGATQIVITSLSPTPFCSSGAPGSACTDALSGFDFRFTGEDILGLSVDPSSAPDFQPVAATFQGNTHLGLQLLSANEILVDLTGDQTAVGDELVLDLAFESSQTPTTSVPEPATLVLFGQAWAGLVAVRARRKRQITA